MERASDGRQRHVHHGAVDEDDAGAEHGRGDHPAPAGGVEAAGRARLAARQARAPAPQAAWRPSSLGLMPEVTAHGHDQRRELFVAGGELVEHVAGHVEQQHARDHRPATLGVFENLRKDRDPVMAAIHRTPAWRLTDAFSNVLTSRSCSPLVGPCRRGPLPLIPRRSRAQRCGRRSARRRGWSQGHRCGQRFAGAAWPSPHTVTLRAESLDSRRATVTTASREPR